MRRATAAVFGTFGGAALILAAKFGVGTPQTGAAAANSTTDQTGALPPASTGSGGVGSGSSRRTNAGSGSGGAPGASGLKDGLFRGAASRNQYGPIQVTIRVAGGKITGVTATHATDQARTIQVNTRAIPVLRQETLKAQSARIDTVSGATFTSGSFTASLQSALAGAKG